MNIYHHHRLDDSIALYIDGNLQFDTRDEAIYHESLVLPALTLASNPRRVLICGGGDGLALREVLRFPAIESVTLVDCSSEVVDFARSRLAEVNQHAFEDPRVNVVIADALTYPLRPGEFDVIFCDFTFPTTAESAQGFTVEWYAKLKSALAPGGLMAINGVSPQNTASAFACLVASLRQAGLKTLPYRVCIPSFRDHGYGAWGFILAADHVLRIGDLAKLSCPVETKLTDLNRLAEAAHFSASERAAFRFSPVNTAAHPVLQSLLLNPNRSQPVNQEEKETPPDFSGLVQQVEISHPYHSRSMIEALAEEVIGSIHTIDLRKLVEELSKRAKKLPARIREELACLQEYLSRTVLDLDLWGKWASRLFATLILVMVIANTISPDPAFAKGGLGLGHASFSRGFAESSSLGSHDVSVASPITGRGFASTYGREPVDIYGYHYAPRVYIYGENYGPVYSGGGNRRLSTNVQPLHQPHEHKPLFVLDDDLMAMDNGDFVIPLSDTAMLVLNNGNVQLMNSKTGRSLLPIYAEPKLFQEIRSEVAAQSKQLDTEVSTRRDWLAWVGWTSSMFKSVQEDTLEFGNLQDLQRRLGIAMKSLGQSKEAKTIPVPPDAVELFVGCHILRDNEVVIYSPGGNWLRTDGTRMVDQTGKVHPLSPELKTAIVSILKKMITETEKDIVSNRNEGVSLALEEASTKNDLQQYETIQSQNSFDPTYEVDYGTDTVTVVQAIRLTQSDLESINLDRQLLEANTAKSQNELAAFKAALQAWG